jgi:uncharacterized membrane protein
MRKSKHNLQNNIYDSVIDYFGSWQSLTVITFVTLGLITNGLIRHIPLESGYWVITNLMYSVTAIFEAEIILMGQKRRAEEDEIITKATYKFTKHTEKMLEKLIEEQERD